MKKEDLKNKGLVNKYQITKTDGSPMPEGGEYFVLRLDNNQKDKEHELACICAITAYARAIRNHLPELSKELLQKYGTLDII